MAETLQLEPAQTAKRQTQHRNETKNRRMEPRLPRASPWHTYTLVCVHRAFMPAFDRVPGRVTQACTVCVNRGVPAVIKSAMPRDTIRLSFSISCQDRTAPDCVSEPSGDKMLRERASSSVGQRIHGLPVMSADSHSSLNSTLRGSELHELSAGN